MAGRTRNVVLAVDGSPQAEAAVTWYLENAHQPYHQVVVVHCIVPPPGRASSEQYVYDEMFDHLVGTCKTIQTKYRDLLVNRKLAWAFASTIYSQPGEWIILKAGELKAGLIVIGSRGMGTIRRTLMGSTSSNVLHHATCPVAVCPPVKTAQKPAQKSAAKH